MNLMPASRIAEPQCASISAWRGTRTPLRDEMSGSRLIWIKVSRPLACVWLGTEMHQLEPLCCSFAREPSMHGPIRIAVIEPCAIFRLGIVQAFGRSERYVVVGEGASLADAQRIVRERQPD